MLFNNRRYQILGGRVLMKQDWIEVLNESTSRDWTDYLLITASILSPIIVLLTAIYASKSKGKVIAKG